MQHAQEAEFSYSLYISGNEEESQRELQNRPINKEALIQAMNGLNLEGAWRINQTAMGLIVNFMRESDLEAFRDLDICALLGLSVTAYSFSSLDTYRQKVMVKDIPDMVSLTEIQAALQRQGINPLCVTRTPRGNVILELGEPHHFKQLLHDGFDFFASARFAVIPLPARPFAPPFIPAPQEVPRDAILQCFKCQGFWHFAAQCTEAQRCVRCGQEHAVADCPRPRYDPVCVHCRGRHHAAYKLCPTRLGILRSMMELPPIYIPTYLPPFNH